MKAQDIWKREYYAYVSHPSRGVPLGEYVAREVQAVSIRQEEPSAWSGRERKSTIVTVIFNPDTEEAHTQEVNARNLVGFWDDYVDERAAYEKKRKEQLDEQQRRWEAKDRERQERVERMNAERARIEQEAKNRDNQFLEKFCEETGIDPSQVTLGPSRIYLDRREMELWVSVRQVEVRQ